MRKTLVIVSDPDDERRGKITLADDAGDAARVIETLLESGCSQSLIRVFYAAGLDMSVQHRPVVSIARTSPVLEVAGSETLVAAATPAGDSVPFVKDGVRFSSLFRPD